MNNWHIQNHWDQIVAHIETLETQNEHLKIELKDTEEEYEKTILPPLYNKIEELEEESRKLVEALKNLNMPNE
jgi:chromosome segregation ATPase